MSDIAQLGLGIDTAQVRQASGDLRNFRGAGADASAAARDFNTASAQLARQLAEVTAAQQQTNRILQEGRIHTTSYVDSLAKVATVAAGATLAYRGMSE